MDGGVGAVVSYQAIDYPTRRILPARAAKPKAFVVHTTGETDLDKILRFYTDEDGFQPHMLIEVSGVRRRIVPADHIAYHCKIDPAEARLYQRGYSEWCEWVWKNDQPVHMGTEFTGYRAWRDTWRTQGLSSPLDLITGAHPNAVSFGIELQAPSTPGPDIFTDDQYRSLAEALGDEGERYGIPLDRKHVLGHYDCSPMRRSTAKGGWDPGDAFKWNRIWDLVR